VATIANNDIWQVRIYTNMQNQLAVNSFYYKGSAVTGVVPSSTWLSQIDAAWASDWKALLTNAAVYLGVTVQRMLPLPKTILEPTAVGTGTGNAGATMMPKQVSGIGTFRTDFAGPSARGRVYIPFPDEADNGATAVPSAGYLTRLTTMMNLLSIPFVVAPGGGNTATLTRVLWHPALSAATALTVTSFLVRAKWATQRRRGDYGQPNQLPF